MVKRSKIEAGDVFKSHNKLILCGDQHYADCTNVAVCIEVAKTPLV